MCVFLCVLQNLHKQLEEAIQDGEIWVMQLKDTEYELESSRERVQQQATEILHKASKICPLVFTTALCSAVCRCFTHPLKRKSAICHPYAHDCVSCSPICKRNPHTLLQMKAMFHNVFYN